MNSTEIRKTVDDYLAAHGMIYAAVHVPTTFDPPYNDPDNWHHVAWKITFTSRAGRAMTTDYKQGVGHLPNWQQVFHRRMTGDDVAAIAMTLKTGCVARRLDNIGRILPGSQKLEPPSAADVLHSLVMDASAADYASYEDYARDTGDNPDSRKGEKIFHACRGIALDLNRVFGHELLAEIRETVQDM